MPTSDDGRSKAEGEHSVAPAEQLARLYRSSLGEGLTASTRALLKRLLLEELQATPSVVTPPSAEAVRPPPPMAPSVAAAEAQRGRAETVVHPLLVPPVPSSEQLDMRLRQLVDADAPWSALEPVAMALYKKRRDAEAAARVLELAFLSATAPQ